MGSSQVSFPEGLSSAAEAEVWGEPLTAGTRMHPTVPGNKADPVPTHLLLQTDAELLGGQRGPRWGRLGGMGQPAGVQIPKLLIVSEDTTEAQLSASRGAASGPKVLPGHTPHKRLHPFSDSSQRYLLQEAFPDALGSISGHTPRKHLQDGTLGVPSFQAHISVLHMHTQTHAPSQAPAAMGTHTKASKSNPTSVKQPSSPANP